MVSLSVWAWVLPPGSAGPLVVMCSLLGQVLNGRLTLAGLRMGRAWVFIAGGALGVPVGAFLLPYLEPRWFRMGLGVFLVGWCGAMLLMRAPRAIGVGDVEVGVHDRDPPGHVAPLAQGDRGRGEQRLRTGAVELGSIVAASPWRRRGRSR